MKSGLLVICLVLLPLTAQDRSDGEKLTVGGGLKGLQPMPRVQVKAESILENSGIIHLKGTVEINLGIRFRQTKPNITRTPEKSKRTAMSA